MQTGELTDDRVVGGQAPDGPAGRFPQGLDLGGDPESGGGVEGRAQQRQK
jgi:hypothetical protein